MHKRLIASALIFGVLATVLSARIDDVLERVGRGRVTPPEFAADASSIMVRRRGISSVEVSLSLVGSELVVPSAVFKGASNATWSTDPLVGMGAASWAGPVQHQVLFSQGWPLDAFSASSTPEGGVRGGVMFGGPGTMRVVAYAPLWSGLLGNTLVFAAVFWLVVSTMSFIRQRLRRRAGLCERCCYPNRGIPSGAPCPECGYS
jgi:hypothetical protein